MSLLTKEYIEKNVPKLGFGLMRLPLVEGSKEIDLEQVKKMADHYMESGMNYFDTAWMYHDGASEVAFREAVVKRYPRESFTVADKMHASFLDTPEDVERMFQTQLERCGVEYFDYYLLHALDGEKHAKNEDFGIYDFALKMKAEGKIKSVGFSFHGTTEDLKKILADRPELEFVQLQLNYYDWEFDYKEQYEIVRAHDKPIIIMEPVRGGFLAKMPVDIENDFKAADPSKSVASWAVRWVASLDGVMTVLSGMSSLEQMVDNVSYMKDFSPMTEAEVAVVTKAAKALIEAPTIPCTDCKYCIDCPVEIPIFDIFKVYNDFVNDKQVSPFKKAYAAFDESCNADACIACGYCESVCPQNIPIIDRLADIHALATN